MVTFVISPDDRRDQVVQAARDFTPVVTSPWRCTSRSWGDTVAPFMTAPDTDPASPRSGLVAFLPADPAAAVAALQRCREEIGASYVVIGSNSADTMAQVVGRLAGS